MYNALFQQYDERRHLNYKREILARRRAKRIAIAEERRRWAVLYYTSDGKPDKRRRPGRPWEASVFAGGDKATYSGGSGVNLMAHIQKEKLARAAGSEFKMGSIKSVEQTLQQVSLQTYLEEVNLYEQLLNPIAEIMEKNMGINPMGLSALAQNGWGAEGAKMVPALQEIGAIPPATAPKKSFSRSASASASFKSEVGSSLGSQRNSDIIPPEDQHKIVMFNNSRKVSMTGSAPAPLPRNVTWKMDAPSSSSLSASRGAPRGEEVELRPGLAATPLEVLKAAKARKQAARKSFLPALDAHTYLYDHQRPPEQTAYIGDLKTLDRLYVKQAQDARLGRVITDRRASAAVEKLSPVPSSSSAVPNARSQAPRGSQQLMPLGVSMQQLIGTERSSRDRAVKDVALPHALASGVEAPDGEVYWTDIHKESREEAERQRLAAVEARRARKRNLTRTSTIPWELLDSLDGAKQRFENEKLYHEFNHKY